MGAVATNVNAIGTRTNTWILRHVVWFATAYTIIIILHEAAHALTAYALGFPSTLFNFWVNSDFTRATIGERAVVDVAGPSVSLCAGLVCWVTYRRVKDSAAGLPLAYLAAFGASNFFGNLMSAAFVGDFSNAALKLGLSAEARYAVSFIGAVSIATILFAVGRELRQWTPRHVGRITAAIGAVVLPVLVGTALVVSINQPIPIPISFVAARAVEGSLWLSALVGTLVTRNRPTTSDEYLRLRWADALVAIVVVLVVRLLVQGIPLTP